MANDRKRNGAKTPNTPDFLVFHVEERGNGKPNQWNRIGAAWTHEDGNGLNVQIRSIPINFDGKLTLRIPIIDDSLTEGEGR